MKIWDSREKKWRLSLLLAEKIGVKERVKMVALIGKVLGMKLWVPCWC